MVRNRMAPLFISLVRHRDLEFSRHKGLLRVMMDKFYEFAREDPEYADIHHTVIWETAKRFLLPAVPRIETSLLVRWEIHLEGVCEIRIRHGVMEMFYDDTMSNCEPLSSSSSQGSSDQYI